MSLPISSDYQIVPSNNFNQTIKYVFLDASEICHTIDIITQEVKSKYVRKLCAFKDAHTWTELRIGCTAAFISDTHRYCTQFTAVQNSSNKGN